MGLGYRNFILLDKVNLDFNQILNGWSFNNSLCVVKGDNFTAGIIENLLDTMHLSCSTKSKITNFSVSTIGRIEDFKLICFWNERIVDGKKLLSGNRPPLDSNCSKHSKQESVILCFCRANCSKCMALFNVIGTWFEYWYSGFTPVGGRLLPAPLK